MQKVGPYDVSRSDCRSFISVCTVLVDAFLIAQRRCRVESRHRVVNFCHVGDILSQRIGARVKVSRKIASATSPSALRRSSSWAESKITGCRSAKKNSSKAHTHQLGEKK